VSGFDHMQQLGLWTAPQSEQEKRLSQALDDIRARFGERSVRRGSLVDADDSGDDA